MNCIKINKIGKTKKTCKTKKTKKSCCRCKVVKKLNQYCKNKTFPDGHHVECKVCCLFRSREYAKTHKEEIRLASKKWRKNNPDKKISKEKNKENFKRWYKKNKLIHQEKVYPINTRISKSIDKLCVLIEERERRKKLLKDTEK